MTLRSLAGTVGTLAGSLADWISMLRSGKRLGALATSTFAVEEVSRDEVIRGIDEHARKRVGLSAHELLAAYRSGNMKKIAGDVSDLLAYAELLPADDPIFTLESTTTGREAESEVRYALR